jgi:DNA-binding response OmpR family regulator
MSVSVLIIDDSRDAAIPLATFLNKFGYETHVINQPELVRSSIDEFRPDIILLDLRMPRMNGIETATLIRSDGFTGLLIAVTGCADEESRERAREAGFDHYLVKPVYFPTLMSLLRSADGVDQLPPRDNNP